MHASGLTARKPNPILRDPPGPWGSECHLQRYHGGFYLASRNALRKKILAKRQNQGSGERRSSSLTASKILISSDIYQQSHHIGFYQAFKGELNPAPVLDHALNNGKQCYLPTLDPRSDESLIFVSHKRGEALIKNRFEIPEPVITPNNVIAPTLLDLVIVPLVGFSGKGDRLGMGKGYYDRTFAYKIENSENTKPILAGYAYDFQKCPNFDVKKWDVPLDCVFTEKELYWF